MRRSSATRFAVFLPTSSSWTLPQRALADDADLVLLVLPELRDLLVLDRRERSSFSTPLREKTRASITVPSTPGGTRRDVSRTSPAFSPKMARSSFSSGESCVSPFGVILPTRMSPGLTSAPMRMMPDSSRSLQRLLADVRDVARDLLRTELGVARDALELLDVDRGEEVVLDDALGDEDRVLEVVAAPRHEGDEHVAPERQLAHARSTGRRRSRRRRSRGRRRCTIGFWLMQVFWFERWYLIRL